MTMDARPDDELASAYLDEEATPEERARVENDPDLLMRVGQLRVARDLLREPPMQMDPDLVDHQVSAALFASAAAPPVAAPSSASESGDRPADVVPLSRFRSAAPRAALAAVAAIAIFIMGISFLGNAASSQFSSVGTSISGGGGLAFSPADSLSRDSEAADAATSADSSGAPTAALAPTSTLPSPDDDSIATDDIPAYEAAESPSVPSLEPLGQVENGAALADELQRRLDDPESLTFAFDDDGTATLPAPGAIICDDETALRNTRVLDIVLTVNEVLLGTAPIATIDAEVDGAPVTVLLLGPAGDDQVTAALLTDPTGCTPPSSLPLR